MKSIEQHSLFSFILKVLIGFIHKTTVKIVLSMVPEEIKENMTVFLTIDDTLQEKFGTKFDCYQKHFDHANKTGSEYLNGHYFVSLVVNIPDNGIKYLPLPVGYRVYDGKESKLKIPVSLIDIAINLLKYYQVVLLWDSWYPKSDVLKTIKNYNNLDLIASEEILIIKDSRVPELEIPKDKEHLTHLFIYKLRWNVEVLFYQHKFFWLFGIYMVRN